MATAERAALSPPTLTTTTNPAPTVTHPNPAHAADSLEAKEASVAAPSSPTVSAPSTSSSSAKARFEFEAGRGTHDGTKVLLVEWADDATTRSAPGAWHVSWEGKTTVLPAAADTQHLHRVHFLLPPGAAVPPTVTLTHVPFVPTGGKETTWRTNPLPALYPAALGVGAAQQGKKGVLHTVWAKQRLRALGREIASESANNAEGVALALALQERDWIEANFGVTQQQQLPLSPVSAHPGTPVSPTGGGRLAEKLKGLRLETAEGSLTPRTAGEAADLMSPEEADVAMPSFAGFAQSTSARTVPRPSAGVVRVEAPMVGRGPSRGVGGGGMASLNALAAGKGQLGTEEEDGEEENEREDDLFALPISPRSPEMGRSPFSFQAQDTARYVEPRPGS